MFILIVYYHKAYLLKNKIRNKSGPLPILGILFDGFAPIFHDSLFCTIWHGPLLNEECLLNDPTFRNQAEIIGCLVLRSIIIILGSANTTIKIYFHCVFCKRSFKTAKICQVFVHNDTNQSSKTSFKKARCACCRKL